MDDSRIISLYLDRSEEAISATAEKYGRYCHSIAFHILRSLRCCVEKGTELENYFYYTTEPTALP